ncbi:hypothetical protein [Dongia sp.]|jgi:hypothetical protein|uniref:hypothetical protein n=1 Tax=Dongia sp. TaxID=1977262 RepID=UPI0035B47889
MKLFARFFLIAIVAAIVLGALVFVWAMQREIDVSTAEARAQYHDAMMLGCKLRLPEVMKSVGLATSLQPEQANSVCDCAVARIIETYAVGGKIRPSDVTEEQTDAAELACIKEQTAQ